MSSVNLPWIWSPNMDLPLFGTPTFLPLSLSQKHIHVPGPLGSAWIFPRCLEKSSNYLQLYFYSLQLFEKFQIDFQLSNAASILIRFKHWKSTVMNHWLSWHYNLFSLPLVDWTGCLHLHLLNVPGFVFVNNLTWSQRWFNAWLLSVGMCECLLPGVWKWRLRKLREVHGNSPI